MLGTKHSYIHKMLWIVREEDITTIDKYVY